jgi:hypothetical protein
MYTDGHTVEGCRAQVETINVCLDEIIIGQRLKDVIGTGRVKFKVFKIVVIERQIVGRVGDQFRGDLATDNGIVEGAD